MSERFWTTDEQIERVCGYLTDDRSVAAYFGIATERVARVRANMPEKPRWLFRADAHEGGKPSWGINSRIAAAEQAELGSRNLNAAIQRLFLQWEDKHGFQRGAAKILLPAGYVPEREAA